MSLCNNDVGTPVHNPWGEAYSQPSLTLCYKISYCYAVLFSQIKFVFLFWYTVRVARETGYMPVRWGFYTNHASNYFNVIFFYLFCNVLLCWHLRFVWQIFRKIVRIKPFGNHFWYDQTVGTVDIVYNLGFSMYLWYVILKGF